MCHGVFIHVNTHSLRKNLVLTFLFLRILTRALRMSTFRDIPMSSNDTAVGSHTRTAYLDTTKIGVTRLMETVG